MRDDTSTVAKNIPLITVARQLMLYNRSKKRKLICEVSSTSVTNGRRTLQLCVLQWNALQFDKAVTPNLCVYGMTKFMSYITALN